MRIRVSYLFLCGVVLVANLGLRPDPAASAPPDENEIARSFRDHVTDRISLQGHSPLRGCLLSRNPLQICVRSKHILEQSPDLYEQVVLPAVRMHLTLHPNPLIQELESAIAEVRRLSPDERQQIGLLEEILSRLTPDEPDVAEWIVLEISKSQLKRSDLQSDARRELCRLAILNNIQDIETRHWKSVAAQLVRIPQSDLVREFTPPADTDSAMLSIQAAVNVRLNMALRLIRQGDQIVDESVEQDLSGLLSTMLGGSIQELISELASEPAFHSKPSGRKSPEILPERATRLAEEQNKSTIILSDFHVDVSGGSTSVRKRLFHKPTNGSWKLLLSVEGSAMPQDVDDGQVAAIENDPQIRELSTLVEGLGLGGVPLNQAIRSGAVVRRSLQMANEAFENQIQGIINTESFRRRRPPVVVRIE